MRKAVTVLMVTVAVVVASLWWTGFVALQTFLDPDRGDQVVSAVLDDDAVRDRLADEIARQMGSQLVGVASPDQVHEAAVAALDDPRLKESLEDSIVALHKQMLDEGPDVPPSVDGTAVAAAGRDALLEQHPELAGRVPEVPPLLVQPPVTDVPDLSGVRDFLQGINTPFLLVSLILFGLAFAVTDDQAWVLRRFGAWALANGLAWFFIGVVAPRLVGAVAPGAKVSALAITGALLGAIIPLSIGLVILGGSALAAGYLWTSAGKASPPPPPPPPPAPRPPNRGIRRAGSYQIQTKNPRTPPPPGRGPTSPGRQW